MRLTALLSMAAKAVVPKGYRYGMNNPGTYEMPHIPGRKKQKVFVEPLKPEDWTLFRGDRVEILAGKDKGKQGKVFRVIRKKNWVVVKGLNTYYRYISRTSDYPGVCIIDEIPLTIHDVALVDPSDMKPVEVEWKFTEEGERVRVSVRTGRIIPKPIVERLDKIVPEHWIDGPKDTSPEDALEKSHVPSLKTMEEEVMEKMGIVENRRHRRTYWY